MKTTTIKLLIMKGLIQDILRNTFKTCEVYVNNFEEDKKEDGSDAPDRYYWNEQKLRWEL